MESAFSYLYWCVWKIIIIAVTIRAVRYSHHRTSWGKAWKIHSKPNWNWLSSDEDYIDEIDIGHLQRSPEVQPTIKKSTCIVVECVPDALQRAHLDMHRALPRNCVASTPQSSGTESAKRLLSVAAIAAAVCTLHAPRTDRPSAPHNTQTLHTIQRSLLYNVRFCMQQAKHAYICVYLARTDAAAESSIDTARYHALQESNAQNNFSQSWILETSGQV